MPTDTITTEERVLLAEFCGHEVRLVNGIVWIGLFVNGLPCDHRYEPEVDANQRDELVEALRKRGIRAVLRSHTVEGAAFSECLLVWNVRGVVDDSARGKGVTPGLAVFRAALKVISFDSKPKTR